MPFVFDPMPHEEAVKRIAGLPLMSREMFDELLPELKAYAFTITGLDSFDQLSRTRDLIQAVPAGEKTWDKAKKEIAAELDDALTGKQAETRAELLLRTHTFRAYAAARYRLLMSQRDVFPFWQYKTHGDDRVRPSHRELGNKIFPAAHPIWQRIFPPCDWGCRCLVAPLLRNYVERIKKEEANLAPEKRTVYDGEMADAIAAADRLPSGTSLLPSPTWAASPWSEPGTVRHTWELIQERYKNDPETLAKFSEWAKKTQIPDRNQTVWQWVNGEEPGAKSAAKPKAKDKKPAEPKPGEHQQAKAADKPAKARAVKPAKETPAPDAPGAPMPAEPQPSKAGNEATKGKAAAPAKPATPPETPGQPKASGPAKPTAGTETPMPALPEATKAAPAIKAFEAERTPPDAMRAAAWARDGHPLFETSAESAAPLRPLRVPLADAVLSIERGGAKSPLLEDLARLFADGLAELRVVIEELVFRFGRGVAAVEDFVLGDVGDAIAGMADSEAIDWLEASGFLKRETEKRPK